MKEGLFTLCDEMAGVVGFEPTVRGTKNRCLTTWLHPNGVRVINADVGRVQALNRENDKVFAFGFMGEKSGSCLRRFRCRCAAVMPLRHREKCPLMQVFDPTLAPLTFGDDTPLVYRNAL